MDLFEHREAIVKALKALLPARVEVIGIAGRFTADELEHTSMQAPAVMVSLLGGLPWESSSKLYSTLNVAAYVLTKNGRGGRAGDAGLILVNQVLSAVNEGRLSEHAQTPTALRWDNLFNSSFRQDGVWLGVAGWRQVAELTRLADDALAEFLTLHATFDLAPVDGVADAENLISVRSTEQTP